MQQFIRCPLLIAIACSLLASAEAQERSTSPHILPGPARTVVMVHSLFSPEGGDFLMEFPTPEEQFAVFRADAGASEFQNVGVAHFPTSPGDMQRKLGEALTGDLLAQLNVSDVKAAYLVLQQHSVDTLGVLLFSPEVLEALGILFVDRSRNPEVASRYRVDRVDANGNTLNSETASVSGALPNYPGRYVVHEYLVSDSLASVSWTSNSSIVDGLPLFANVYRRNGQSGAFEPIKRLFVTGDDTSEGSWINFHETLPPAQHLAYYVQLEDFAGNTGLPSDTLYAIAFDRAQLSGITNLQVADTTEGLLLTWEPLPKQAVYSAIQILKSRELGADYVVVDTISAWETHYLDESVIPASSYYYKVRPLLYNLAGADALQFAEANGHKSMPESSLPPAAPRDVHAILTDEGVKISWQHGDELNLFGYYVLRGPSTANLEVVSQPVQDTVYIDSLFSPGFSGQLHYALQVADLSQQVSDTSEVVSVTIIQPVVLAAPGGLQARRTLDGVSLQWENAMLRDDLIAGFVVYRRKAAAETYDLLPGMPLRLPFFTDSNAITTDTYEYAVTSIDSWGNQSIFSPTALLERDLSATLSPPLELNLRNLSAGIEIGWPAPLLTQESQYVIFRKASGQAEFTKIGNVPSNTSYLDRDVKPGTLYEYAVAVASGDNLGETSDTKAIRRQ